MECDERGYDPTTRALSLVRNSGQIVTRVRKCGQKMKKLDYRGTGTAFFLVQLILIVLYAALARYSDVARPQKPGRRRPDEEDDTAPVKQYYGNTDQHQWRRTGQRSAFRRRLRSLTQKKKPSASKKTSERFGPRCSRHCFNDPTFGIVLLYTQGTLICAYSGLVVYHPQADASDQHNSVFPAIGGFPQDKNVLRQRYPVFQDVHVMVVVGFGFLMVFLRKYGYSSVGFTLLLTAVMVQWAMLFLGLYHLNPVDGKVHLSINSMVDGDVATAAVLISMGAVLGRTTPIQLLVMGIVEIMFYSVNAYLCSTKIQSADLGGSMVIHVFGAYFGLAVSRVLGPPATPSGTEHADESSSYISDIIAMIGTTFLWVFWPSFNGVLAVGHSQHRAVLNTYIALAASCTSAMATSALLSGSSGRLKMVHTQNATLAGGVAVGAVADLMITPAGALGIGTLAGVLSVVGYNYLQPFLFEHFRLHDTCGVNNLHGMPGIISGLLSAVMAVIADEDLYKYSLYQLYPARAPESNSSALGNILEETKIEAGSGRSAGSQAAYQLLALLSSLTFGLVGGAVTGLILREERIIRQVSGKEAFGDAMNWELPDDARTADGIIGVMANEVVQRGSKAKDATILEAAAIGGSQKTRTHRLSEKQKSDESSIGPAVISISNSASVPITGAPTPSSTIPQV